MLTDKIASNKLKTILDESEYEGDNPDWQDAQGRGNMTYEDWLDYYEYTGQFGNYSTNDTEYMALYEDYLENNPPKTKRVKRAEVIETDDRLSEGDTRGKHGKAGESHGKPGEKHGKTGEKHGKAGEKHGKTGKRYGKAGEKHGTGKKHDKVHEKEDNYSEQPGNAGEKHDKAQEKEGNAGDKGAEKQKKNGEKQGESRERNKTSQKVGIRKKFKMFVNAVRKRNNS